MTFTLYRDISSRKIIFGAYLLYYVRADYRNPKLNVLLHLGTAVCRILFLVHYHLDFGLWLIF